MRPQLGPKSRLDAEAASQAIGVDEVGKRLLVPDENDGDPLTVAALELRIARDVDLLQLERDVGTDALDHPPCALAEMTAGRRVQGDADRFYG